MQAVAINDACHAASVRFIMTDTFGLFGSLFCDFGNDFTIYGVPIRIELDNVSHDQDGCLAPALTFCAAPMLHCDAAAPTRRATRFVLATTADVCCAPCTR